jgi:hypothetical protein
VWRLLKKLRIDLSMTTFLGIYPKECKSVYERDTCIPMFMAALFTMAKLWNQPRCLTTDEWIMKILL